MLKSKFSHTAVRSSAQGRVITRYCTSLVCDLMPVIQKIDKLLAGWMASYLSWEHLIMINVLLCYSYPLYDMLSVAWLTNVIFDSPEKQASTLHKVLNCIMPKFLYINR
jgi:hypothetical protein